MLKYLSYISKQAHSLSDAEMQQLLINCRKNNEAASVTGLLIHYQGSFVQFLEGPEKEIEPLFQKITKDSRHYDVTELDAGFIENRQFPEWTMAFKKLDSPEAEKISGYTDLDRKQLFLKDQGEEAHPALKLLNSFVNNL